MMRRGRRRAVARTRLSRSEARLQPALLGRSLDCTRTQRREVSSERVRPSPPSTLGHRGWSGQSHSLRIRSSARLGPTAQPQTTPCSRRTQPSAALLFATSTDRLHPASRVPPQIQGFSIDVESSLQVEAGMSNFGVKTLCTSHHPHAVHGLSMPLLTIQLSPPLT